MHVLMIVDISLYADEKINLHPCVSVNWARF